MKLILFAIYSILTLTSCNRCKYKVESNSLLINTPKTCFSIRSFVKNNKKYFYTFDFSTLSSVFFFDSLGHRVDSLHLKSFERDNSCDLKDIIILDDNQYLLLADFNFFYVVNKKLKILDKFNFFQNYELGEWLAPGQLFYCQKNIYTAIIPKSSSESRKLKTMKEKNSESHHSPIISKIELKRKKLTTIGRKANQRILRDYELNYTFPRYFVSSESEIIYYNQFVDTLFEIDQCNFKIRPIIKVESNIGEITLPKVHYSILLKGGGRVVNKISVSNSFIDRLVQDSLRNIWYVIIRKPIDNKNNFPFNVLVYNNQWEKLDEIEFDSKKYRYNFFIAEKGLYIEKLNTNPASTVRKFDCLVYEKQGE